MHDRDDDQLTAAEREAFEALPREAMPGRLLEERVVSALRVRGLLGERHVTRRFAWSRIPIGFAAAAGVALFASGLAFGQWMGARHTAQVMLDLQKQDAANASAAVERTGKAYLSALGALAQASASSDPAQVARAREAAESVLHDAANEMVRISPDDPVSAGILKSLDSKVEATPASANGKRKTVWF
ncbi:MAG TPA: hypothetical protein VJY35_11370 [Candidatus Eisenbacteria bacterium]|nr:hypothetical protein [Candidatus Eisenbacteria bacterium]